jgi:hypothetical protein
MMPFIFMRARGFWNAAVGPPIIAAVTVWCAMRLPCGDRQPEYSQMIGHCEIVPKVAVMGSAEVEYQYSLPPLLGESSKE